MKYLALCFALASVGLSGPAAAEQNSAPTVATPEDTTVTAPGAKPKKDKKVCRERMRSGSHLSNIVCKTPEQWAELQEQLDTEAEYGIPGNRTASGRAVNTGTISGSPPK